MDENNLNPNGENNNPLPGNDPYNMNSNPYQSSDPYASMNPDFNQNPDPYASMNTDFNQNPDPYAGMNPDFNQNQDSNATNFNNGLDNSQTQPISNINDFDNNNQVLNPILNQSLPGDSNNQVEAVTDSAPTLPGQDFDNSQVDSNMNYQDNNNFVDPNMNYQDNNNFVDPNMNYQDNNNFVDPNMNNNQNFNQNFGNSNASGDYNMDFVKAWMGTLYDKAHSKKFNWCAAIFGEIYLLYRKMYLTGSLLAVLRLLLFFLTVFLLTKVGVASLALFSVIGLAFFLGCGFGFYPLYRNFVKNKLNKLKQSTPDNSQLVNLASQKGNTSVIAVIVYCVVVPIIESALLAMLATAKIIDFTLGFINDANDIKNEIINQIDEDFDYQLLEFTDGYSIEYDALTWFYNEEDQTLTKGDYVLTYSGQSVTDIKSVYNLDVTNINDRATLLNSLVSNFQSQAASLNLSVQSGTSNFVTGTSVPNVYYSYIDVESENAITRYYLILLPEDDTLFQFTLNVTDTTVDNTTNTDVISILTSASSLTDSDVDTENQDDNSNIVEDGDNNETFSEAIENSATRLHNTGFTSYFGDNQTTATVKSLVSEVRSNNITDDSSKITIIFDGEPIDTDAMDTNAINSIFNTSDTYFIGVSNNDKADSNANETITESSPAYYSNGYIRIIIIKTNTSNSSNNTSDNSNLGEFLR